MRIMRVQVAPPARKLLGAPLACALAAGLLLAVNVAVLGSAASAQGVPAARAVPIAPGARTALAAQAASVAQAAGAALATQASTSTDPVPPYNTTVTTRIRPQAEQLLVQLAQDGRKLSMDGVPVFNGDDKFLPGKIAIGLAEFLVTVPANDPRRAEYIADFRRIAKLTVDDPNDTWGIYYYLSGLNKLRQAGILRDALDAQTLAKLRVRLDWRTFVDVDSYALIDHPNNYYCVAFGIARLRTAMGWEDTSGSERLLEKMLAHYREFSGEFGFADETDGEGRFDRYSVLLSAEIAQRFIETGAQPPREVIEWVRKSADVMLPRLNAQGEGFEYGRSLGPYGETAIVEVLTAAAVLGVLNPQEMALSYAYISRVGQRYVSFWLNPQTGSVDLWDRGRRTDAYRGKFRILGENLSLAHQFSYTNENWNQLGYRDKAPMAGFEQALRRLPKRTVTWFARGEYDRVLLTLRDRDRVIGLPLINGGASQHMHSPYFPIPFSPGMLAGVADGTAPLLIPQFTLEDGSVLAPLAYFQHVEIRERGAKTIVKFKQPHLDKLGGPKPIPDDRLSLTSTYTFSPGKIARVDVYTPKSAVNLKAARLEYATYSDTTKGFKATGFEECRTDSVSGNRDYQTPAGPLRSRVSCGIGPRTLSGPVTLSWSLNY